VPEAVENYVDCHTRWIRFFFAPSRLCVSLSFSASLGELLSQRKKGSTASEVATARHRLERTIRANDQKATATYGHREPVASFEFFRLGTT
jgi:hypothetical protein